MKRPVISGFGQIRPRITSQAVENPLLTSPIQVFFNNLVRIRFNSTLLLQKDPLMFGLSCEHKLTFCPGILFAPPSATREGTFYPT